MARAADYTHPSAQILFHPFGKRTRPLFSSVSDLARAIAGIPRPHYKGRPEHLPSMLAQFFRRKRRLPAPLREDLLAATQARADEYQVAIDLNNLRLQTEQTTGRTSGVTSQPLLDEFLEKATTASRQFILTSIAAEESNNRYARDLRRILLARYKLLGGPGQGIPNVSSPNRADYVFNLRAADAAGFWGKLYDELTVEGTIDNPFTPQETNDILQQLDGRIEVWAVPDRFCVPPMVLFFLPDGRQELFCISYHGDDGLHVAKMNDDVRQVWVNHIYDPLTKNEDSRRRERFTPRTNTASGTDAARTSSRRVSA